MQRIASRGLLRLGQENLCVARNQVANRCAAIDDLLEAQRTNGGKCPADLRRGAGEGVTLAESAMESNRALAANRHRFDSVAIPRDDQQRDQPRLREINRIDGCAGLVNDFALRQADLLQVSVQHRESVRGQRRQEAVVPMVLAHRLGQGGS